MTMHVRQRSRLRTERRRLLSSVPALAAALGAAGILSAASVAGASPSASSGGAAQGYGVRVVFTGQGGGRYLDVTRWLREDTRECYARRTADETLSVSWRVAWTGRVVPTGGGASLERLKRARTTAAGAVRGSSARDACDAAEEVEPGWIGSDRCLSTLPAKTAGELTSSGMAGGSRLALAAPAFGGPSRPCELDIRNDQLHAHVALRAPDLERLAAGKKVAIAVGTDLPRAGDSFMGTRNCSAFPHIYEGVVYLYDCDDTLVWKGTVSLQRT